jgi:hypothetical protein
LVTYDRTAICEKPGRSANSAEISLKDRKMSRLNAVAHLMLGLIPLMALAYAAASSFSGAA